MPVIEGQDTPPLIAAPIAALLAGVFLNGIGVEIGWAAGAGLVVCLVVFFAYQFRNEKIAVRNRNVIDAEEQLWRDVRARVAALKLGMESVKRRTDDCHVKLFGDPSDDLKIYEADE